MIDSFARESLVVCGITERNSNDIAVSLKTQKLHTDTVDLLYVSGSKCVRTGTGTASFTTLKVGEPKSKYYNK